MTAYGRFIHLDDVTDEPIAKPAHDISGRFLYSKERRTYANLVYCRDPNLEVIETNFSGEERQKLNFLVTGENNDNQKRLSKT